MNITPQLQQTQDIGAERSTSLPQNYLYGSRVLDFFLLGGLAILVWIPFYFLSDAFSPITQFGSTLPFLAVTLSLWVNQPHFMASYKLAYTQGGKFVLENKFQLIIVPLTMVAIIAIGVIFWDVNITTSSTVLSLNNTLQAIGVDTRFGLYPNFGTELMGFLVIFMYFTVGWHYSKQTFGAMMVYARFDNYSLTLLQRNLIRYSLLSTWWVSWMYSNASVGSYPFFNLTIHRLGLPYWMFQTVYTISGLLLAAAIGLLLIKGVRNKTWPSVNFIVPFVALLLWHVPLFSDIQYFVVIPLFHSLQYFPFIAKVESTRYRLEDRSLRHIRLIMFYIVMIFVGYLSFEWVPRFFDTSFKFGGGYFLVAFILFINIHHYFIDNVLWRFKTKNVRDLLFS